MASNLVIGLAMGLIVIGVLGAIGVGIKNVVSGKSDLKRVSVMVVPLAVFGISYAVFGDFDQAGMSTLVAMMGLMILSIVISSTRGTFKF